MPPRTENRENRDGWRQRAALRARRAAPEPQIRFLPAKPNGGVRAKAVGGFIPGLTRKAFEKYGFSTAQLIVDWPSIVGRDCARVCEPVRLKWPRAAGMYDDTSASDLGRPGATLFLSVDPAHALEIEYQRRQIVDRVNVFFGYKALADLKIVQTPQTTSSPPARAGGAAPPGREKGPGLGGNQTASGLQSPPAQPSATRGEGVPAFPEIEDGGLRQALARLARSIAQRNSS